MELEHLYEIAPALHDALTAEEFDAGIVDTLALAFEEKARGVVILHNRLGAYADAAKAEEERIRALRQAAEKRRDSLLAYLKKCMEAAEIAELPLGTFVAKIQLNPPKVVIDDEDEIPANYITIRQEKVVDKASMARDMKAGEKVAGAHLEQGTSLRIK